MKHTRFILTTLICLFFLEACSLAPSKTAPNSDGTCSENLQWYFLEVSKKSDTTLLHKELQESMSYFADKPMFDTTKFMRSCLGVKANDVSNGTFYSGGEPMNSIGFSIVNSNADMLQYLLTATKYELDEKPINGVITQKQAMISNKNSILMSKAIDILKNKKTSEAAKIIKILQEKGMVLRLNEIIKTGDLETIKVLHENNVDLQEKYKFGYDKYGISIPNCIDVAKQNSNKIYQYLEEQGYKTTEQLKVIAEQKKQEQETALMQEKQERIKEQTSEKIGKITELLKANKLEEGIKECDMLRVIVSDSLKGKYSDLCEKQLVDKVRKLPKSKINTPTLAKVYYDGYQSIQAKIFRIFGEIAVAETIGYDKTISVQISGSIGCNFQHSEYIVGYGKYLGMQSKTIMGSVPHYQLLWCGD
jgi:hypothetical protein